MKWTDITSSDDGIENYFQELLTVFVLAVVSKYFLLKA